MLSINIEKIDNGLIVTAESSPNDTDPLGQRADSRRFCEDSLSASRHIENIIDQAFPG